MSSRPLCIILVVIAAAARGLPPSVQKRSLHPSDVSLASCPTPAPLLPLNISLRGSCEVVVSRFERSEDRLDALPALVPPQCTLVVYDRRGLAACTNSSELPAGARCVAMDNVGHDQTHTWVHYASENYERLPDFVIATASTLDKRNRWRWLREDALRSGFGTSEHSFACISEAHACDFSDDVVTKNDFPEMRLSDPTMTPFFMTEYRGNPVRRAENTPFANWLEHHLRDSSVAQSVLRDARVCHYSAFATTAKNLRALPRSAYAELEAAIASAPDTLSEHNFYIEVAAAALFGAGDPSYRFLGATDGAHGAHRDVA